MYITYAYNRADRGTKTVSQNVIELNGKRYDAFTGAYLGKGSKPAVAGTAQGRVIDGFVRPSHPAHAHPAPKKPQPHAVQAAAHQPPAASKNHTPSTPEARDHRLTTRLAPASHAKPHQPEHAKTLMRRVVHKPDVSLKPAIKLQTPAEVMAKPHSALMRKHSAMTIDRSRMERAVRTDKHYAIRHFLPLDRPAPSHHISAQVPVITVRPEPAKQPIARAASHPPKHADVFEAALARANSHQQPAHKPRSRRTHRRLINTFAVVAAFLVIGGFVGYLNLPNLELRVASVQAGFRASMPAYTPTGYALEQGAKRTGGTVSLSFRSGDSRYTVTQQASDWNSQTLLDNTLALTSPHQTVQKNGQTIYIYGNGANASWVNGGVRYDITGNAQLSTQDITAIASSL